MIVDDSMMMRRNLKKICTQAGHDVICEAANGNEALTAFKRHQPDLITMDINMPVMDGIEAVKKIREVNPRAAIVMISAHNEQSRVYEAIKSGAKNYIVKPIRADKVISVINEVLAKSKEAEKA
jgi:two-component system chemotaxis response regulator CheY